MASLTASTTDATQKVADGLDIDPHYDADAMRLIDVLRSRQGTTVTFTSPDTNNPETVILNCAATGWADQAFGGATLVDALRAANEFVEVAQAEALANAPADQAGVDTLLAVEVEVDAFRRIACRTVQERRRQIDAGRNASNDDQHTRGELSTFARLLILYGKVAQESGVEQFDATLLAHPHWWVREAAHHAVKFAGDMPALMVHAATALLAEAARLERRGA